MASLYIANTSKQHHDFAYRLPEEISVRRQMIPVGGQIRVGGDMSLELIERIIKQHQPYGLKAVSDLTRNRDYVGLCYSIDKPVQLNSDRVMSDTFEKNDSVLDARAEDRREEAAVAIADQIQGTMRDHGVAVPRAEVEIVEETRGTPKIASGYEVMNGAAGSRHNGKLSLRGSGKRR